MADSEATGDQVEATEHSAKTAPEASHTATSEQAAQDLADVQAKALAAAKRAAARRARAKAAQEAADAEQQRKTIETLEKKERERIASVVVKKKSSNTDNPKTKRSRSRSKSRHSRRRRSRTRSRSRLSRRRRSPSSRSRSRSFSRRRSRRSWSASRHDRHRSRSRRRSWDSRRSRSRDRRRRSYSRDRSSAGYRRSVRSPSFSRSHKRYSKHSGDRRSRTDSFRSDSRYDRNNNESDFSDRTEQDSEDTEKVGSRYAHRLSLVNYFCDLDIHQGVSVEHTTFGARDTTPLVKLPPAEGFVPMFHNIMEEIKGKRGSKRARTDPKLPLDIGKFPARNKPNLHTIDSEGQPWLVTAAQHNSSLTSLQAFHFSSIPKVVVEQERVRTWESSAREEFSLASYNTWFLKASREGIDSVQSGLVDLAKKKNIVKKDLGKLWKKLEDVQELVDAAGIGAKRIAENSISDLGSMVLARRDSWLKRLWDSKVISKQDMWDLRTADVNEKSLFDQSELERIHEKAVKRESENLTKKIFDIAREKKEGGKQPFRGGPPGQQSGPFPGSAKRGGAAKFGRGRGNRGRGGRGGRGGRPNPFSKESSSSQSAPFNTGH